MKKILFISTAVLCSLTACEDYNDQFNIESPIQDIKDGLAIALTSGDYSSIASNETNMALALSKDPEDSTYVKALNAIGENGYFANKTEAEWFLPAFITNKYPQADAGSRFVVSYNMYKAPSEYMADFKKISEYTLTNTDYRNVWSGASTATYLSPSTLSKLPEVLSSRINDVNEGDMVAVNYAYSEFEPSTGGSVIPVVYQQIDYFEGEAGNYVIAAKANDGNYYPFGKLEKESYNYGYMNPSAITVTDGIISSDDGSNQVVTIEEGSEGYTLLNGWAKYIYMSGTYNNFNVSTSLPTEGGEWSIEANGDGTFKLKNIEKNKTVKLTYLEKEKKYSYGCYPASSYSYFEDTMKEETGLFTIKDVTLPEGSSYVWKHDNYGYYKASAYVGGVNLPSESWLVSTQPIDLAETEKPALKFNFAFNFLSGNDAKEFFNVKISTDYIGDVKTATWIDLDYDGSQFNGWNFTGQSIDLSQFIGQKITLAFVYKSTDQCAPTAEIKNVAIEKAPYWDVCFFKEVPESETAAQMLKMSRASGAYANTAALYVYREGEWVEYTNDDVNVKVADPALYAEVGADYIARPDNVFPIYLTQNYPFAARGDKAVVIYRSSSKAVSAKEYAFTAGWVAVENYSKRTTIFVKEADGNYITQAGVYLDESLLNNDDGGFIVKDILLTGVNYVWSLDSRYGWKASGYLGDTNYPTESWLLTPAIDLSEAITPQLSFDAAVNFLSGANLADHVGIKVSVDYTDDVKKCNWTDIELDASQWPIGNSWDFSAVGPYDLSAYVGQIVHIAFVYKSTKDTAPTLEVQNVLVSEAE